MSLENPTPEEMQILRDEIKHLKRQKAYLKGELTKAHIRTGKAQSSYYRLEDKHRELYG